MMAFPQVLDVSNITSQYQNDVENQMEVSQHKCHWLRTYVSKWSGQHIEIPTTPILFVDYLLTFFTTLLSISILGVLHYRLLTSHDLAFFIASFGATAVLVFGLPSSPLAQPRNVIGGQVISAIVGCVFRTIFDSDSEMFVPIALSVAVTTFMMQITNTMHAPAGATTIIAITTPTSLPWGGFQFVLMPVLSGSIILVVIAVLINNLLPRRHYPCRWW